MARGNNKPGKLVVQTLSEYGDRKFGREFAEKPLVLGERTPKNAEWYDAIKGHEAAFQKFVSLTTDWEDNVNNRVKVAFKDAYEELPESIKKIITEPPETVKELYRGVNENPEYYRKSSEERWQERYDSQIDLIERASSRENPNEEYIKELKEELASYDKEYDQERKESRESQDVMGWSKSLGVASKFGDYIVRGSQDVDSVRAIISTTKVNDVLKSVFKEDSVLDGYKRGIHRLYASSEGEYITIGTQLTRDAETHSDAWRKSNSEWKSKLAADRRRREENTI